MITSCRRDIGIWLEGVVIYWELDFVITSYENKLYGDNNFS